MTINVDTQLKFSTKFRNSSGALADPSTVTMSLLSPSGVLTSLAAPVVSHDGLGLYSTAFTFGESGTWFARWEATGDIQLTSEDIPVYVSETRFV